MIPKIATDPLLSAIILAIVVATLYAPIGTVQAWRIYRGDKRTRIRKDGVTVPDRSKILLLLAWISTIVTVALLVASALALRRLVGLESLDYAAHILGFAIVLLGTIPFLIDRTMRKIRRMGGPGGPLESREERDEHRDAGRDPARDAVRDPARDAERDPARDAERDATRDG